MTHTGKELDNVLDISHLKIKVGHPNKTEALISKIGNLKLSNGLILYDVLVILEYYVTLISVHKLAKDNKIFVVFDESRSYFMNQDLNLRNVLGIGSQCEGLGHPADPWRCEHSDFPNNSGNDVDSSEDICVVQDEQVTTFEDNIFFEGSLDQNLNTSTQGTQNLKRSSRQSVFPRNYNDFVVDSKVKYRLEKYVGYSKLNSENYCFITQLNINCEPKTFFEASKFPHWTDAMNSEMNALLRNDAWDIVDLPKDRKAIGSKWIFKIKYKSSGEIDRYKARRVAQEFGQKEGIYYEETFSPVVKMVIGRCLLNMDVSNSWPMFQLDVNNAFLYGDLVETMYMKPPEGYFHSNNKVCRFKKSLYGLKQAPRQWNAKLTSALIENGKLKYFLGIEVVDTDKGMCLNQRKYVLNLLSEYGMLACIPAKTPLMSNPSILNEAYDNDHTLDNIIDYQMLMGKRIYLTNTRPVISYDVHCLSQFMHSPLKSYLKSCPSLGIHVIKNSGMNLKVFSDVDWAKCVVTRKSVTGYYVFLNDSFVSWKSKKQNTLSKSSTEAEYRALASVTSKVIWILKF
ncbi:ribonuclease H-like domain-containing protein [Tanacetum coccineum]